MCTIALLVQQWIEQPLIVAANRDERLDRPAIAPQLWDAGPRRILAPRDLEAGGTWLGLNDAGVFVGLTNRFDPRGPAAGARLRSRGQVVLDALAQGDAGAAADAVARLDPVEHRGFHLVAADARAAELVWSDGLRLHRATLGPGVHVITERSFGAADAVREARVQRSLLALAGASPPDDEALREVMAQRAGARGEGPLDVPLVELPSYGYGTRAATVVRLGAGGFPAGAAFRHRDTAPDQGPYRSYDGLLRELA